MFLNPHHKPIVRSFFGRNQPFFVLGTSIFVKSTIAGPNVNQLIQKCITGERAAQSQLYALYAPKMLGVCLRYCRNREEAEETLQEGFVKVFDFIHQFKHAGSFEGWMRKIMVNCALQKYRSQAHLHPVVSIKYAEDTAIASDDILNALDQKQFLLLVQQLPTACRLVFNLYVFEGLKHREIATLLGISEGTSKSNLYDARARLQKFISETTGLVKKTKWL